MKRKEKIVLLTLHKLKHLLLTRKEQYKNEEHFDSHREGYEPLQHSHCHAASSIFKHRLIVSIKISTH